MKKLVKLLAVCGLCLYMLALGLTLGENRVLKDNTIRLHVIAESDSPEDQELKLRVRDAVLEKVDRLTKDAVDAQEAKALLLQALPEIESVANQALATAGSGLEAVVELCKEEYQVRKYDTFSLPSGVYDSLQVTIGSGNGKNWWCVAFPSICTAAASEDLQAAAAGAGFPESLTDTITQPEKYEVSFFLLDCIGKIENFFFSN